MSSKNRSYVYILSNHSKAIYIGVTSDLQRRVWQHRYGSGGIHTSRFNISRLVWFEESDDIRIAIAREKQIINGRRDWKDALIVKTNPAWKDIAEDWFDSFDTLNQVQGDVLNIKG
ncbi:MAG: GIY-YIG nuclease family protein [Chloroflexi bacterium]|jgi:putative endonuclease|nr:GIY-YIG nuclease family protein [Chloroflexota bacterium]MBT5626762.1 GIY-YIG nuclease family protein [Chloroflexota bacterium]